MSQKDGGGDNIQTGNVSGTGIAIGRNASARVTSGLTATDLDTLFSGLTEAAQGAAPERREEAAQAVQDLKDEIAKGEKSGDSTVATLIDKLVEMVPDAVSTVVSTFATPIIGGIVGPVTKFVLDKFKKS